MKRFLVLVLLASCFHPTFGQNRNVSTLFENRMFNYTIIRYSPVWEIQSENEKPVASEYSRLIKKVEDASVSDLKDLLYVKGLVPSELKQTNGSSMEKYLASKRIVIHYRIQYRDYVIFIAHLNNSPTRSVIPFKVEAGRWILDPTFAESEMFRMLSQPFYDVYTGVFNGQAFSYLAFEEIGANGTVYDYSGHGNHGIATGGAIVNGRIGGAYRLAQNTELKVPLQGLNDLKGDRFSIDGHLNISNNYLNAEKKKTVFTVEKQSGAVVEMYLEKGFLNVQVKGVEKMSVPIPKLDTWFHFAVKQAGKKLSLELDGEELDARTITEKDILAGSTIRFGGDGSIKGSLDEFRVAK